MPSWISVPIACYTEFMTAAVSMLVLFAALFLFPVWLAPRLWLVTAPITILGFMAGAP